MPDLAPPDSLYSDPAARPADLGPTGRGPASSGNSGLRKIVVIVVLLLIAGIVVWRIRSSRAAATAEADKTAAATRRPIPVQVALVQQRTVPVYLNALGTVTAYDTVTVNARVSGQMLRVNFREGQAVHKGQLLMEIDPAPYKAVFDQAVGQLAKDEANLKNTQAEANRYTALYNAGVVSKETQQLNQSNAGQASGTIKADQATIEAARVNLNYCRITSPIDGVIGLRQVDPGNIVNAGGTSGSTTTGLVVITQIHPIAVIFTLPEDQLQQVQKAMHAAGSALVVEAYDRTDAHLIATGSLLTIDNQIDTTTGTAKLKSVFNNADNLLFANQFVNVRLILSERPDAIVIPTAAIESGTQGDYVYVVNQGPTPQSKRHNQPGYQAGAASAKKAPAAAAPPADDNKPKFHADATPIHVDFTLGTNSVLTPGALQQGQQVVIDGQEKLVDGGNVTPSAPVSRPAAAPAGQTPSSPTGNTHTGGGPRQ